MRFFAATKIGALVSLTAFVTFSASVCLAIPTTYSGSLSVGDGGLTATGAWNVSTTTLSWVVDDSTPGYWHYSYTLTVPVHGISHIIIEASSGDPWEEFTGLNLFSSLTEPSDWILDTTIQLHTAGGGANPNMPEDMYGIKFDAAFDTTTITVSFDSDRVPVWGDFYSKDGVSSGVDNSLYNAGFINPDPDPTTYPPHDGPEQYHLLVPDTYIPAPGALMLAGIGAGFVTWLRRRRTL